MSVPEENIPTKSISAEDVANLVDHISKLLALEYLEMVNKEAQNENGRRLRQIQQQQPKRIEPQRPNPFLSGITESKRDPLTGVVKQITRREGPLLEQVYEYLRIISDNIWEQVQLQLKSTTRKPR